MKDIFVPCLICGEIAEHHSEFCESCSDLIHLLKETDSVNDYKTLEIIE